jgi:hypothetical protein
MPIEADGGIASPSCDLDAGVLWPSIEGSLREPDAKVNCCRQALVGNDFAIDQSCCCE